MWYTSERGVPWARRRAHRVMHRNGGGRRRRQERDAFTQPSARCWGDLGEQGRENVDALELGGLCELDEALCPVACCEEGRVGGGRGGRGLGGRRTRGSRAGRHFDLLKSQRMGVSGGEASATRVLRELSSVFSPSSHALSRPSSLAWQLNSSSPAPWRSWLSQRRRFTHRLWLSTHMV